MLKTQIQSILEELRSNNMYRHITQIEHNGKYIERSNGDRLLNLASNDYLGLLENKEYNQKFWDTYMLPNSIYFGSGSSRLLTGDCRAARELEEKVEELFAIAAKEEDCNADNATAERSIAALSFNSGYHANTGIIGAIGTLDSTIFIADKLAHASIIDGLKLSGKKFERYRHNDMVHLQRLVDKAKEEGIGNIVIITEAVFSMDGDTAPLDELVKIKRSNKGVILYVDEAHSFGLYGKYGLGLCEHYSAINDIDIIVAPLGKAASSVGALAVMESFLKEFLINKMRTLIFSTALPPVNYARSSFFITNLQNLKQERDDLQTIIKQFKTALGLQLSETVETPILPYRADSAEHAVKLQLLLERNGVLAPAIRPPTVPPNGSRLRLSLTASMTMHELETVASLLQKIV